MSTVVDIHVRLDAKVHALVQCAARDNGRSLNAEINQACKEHVKQAKEQRVPKRRHGAAHE